MVSVPNRKPTTKTVHDQLVSAMASTSVDSPEFDVALHNFSKFEAARNINSSKPLSKDALFSGLTSLAGIVIIVKHEQTAVVSSKALVFVKKFF